MDNKLTKDQLRFQLFLMYQTRLGCLEKEMQKIKNEDILEETQECINHNDQAYHQLRELLENYE